MRNLLKTTTLLTMLGGLLAVTPALAFGKPNAADSANPAGASGYLERQVGHELRMLPYYGIFDNLEYRVEGDRVVLSGEVRWPTLKSDAENVVKRIEGVQGVTNNIKVLPLSSYDDHIRLAVYRAVFRGGSLYRYALGANPSIHIIVENGHVTLVGVVSNQMDKTIATMQANSVPGVFSVTDDLRVES